MTEEQAAAMRKYYQDIISPELIADLQNGVKSMSEVISEANNYLIEYKNTIDSFSNLNSFSSIAKNIDSIVTSLTATDAEINAVKESYAEILKLRDFFGNRFSEDDYSFSNIFRRNES